MRVTRRYSPSFFVGSSNKVWNYLLDNSRTLLTRGRNPHVYTALLLICAILSVSCSSNSPEGVVIRFYKNLNSGEYSKAKEMYSAEALQFVDAQLQGDRFIQWADMETRKGTISDVKVTTGDTRGEKSDVSFTVSYEDGASVNRTVTLKQENGDWKLGLIR